MNYEFWQDYQKRALSTSVYPNKGNNKIYPTLGLMGELGEIAEKFKKMIRDDNNVLTETRKKMIIKEIGDVLWYISAICHELGFEMSKIIIDSKNIENEKYQSVFQEVLETQVTMGIIAININDCETEKCSQPCEHLTPLRACLEYIFFHINNICEFVNMSVEDIASQNIAKLLQRRKCGTIHGDGDNR